MYFQRTTRQRQAILEELRAVMSHPTATELYEAVRTRLPRISLGTVYRNLDLLARQGLIRKLDVGEGQARFDGNPKRHPHVHCLCCARVADLEHVPDALEECKITELGGHEILCVRVAYIGVCPACRRAMSADELTKLREAWE